MPEFNDESGKWEVKIKDAQDNVLETKEFNSQGEADEIYRATIEEAIRKAAPELDKPPKKPTQKEQVKNQESILEQKLKNLGAQQPPPQGQPQPGQTGAKGGSNWLAKDGTYDAENIAAEMDKFKKEFEEKEQKHVAKAKAALSSVAKLYLGEKIFTKNEAVKYMLEIEEINLSGLLSQLNVAREGMFKLSQYIALGAMNSRLWEVMGTLSKTILDTIKFQHEYMMDIPEMMKKIREDVMSGNIGDIEEIGGTVLEDGTKTNTSGTTGIPDRKQLIDGLNEQLMEIKQYMAIPSRNKKLAHEEDDAAFTDVVELDKNDESNMDGIFIDKKRGLSTFTDDDDEQEREIPDDEEQE